MHHTTTSRRSRKTPPVATSTTLLIAMTAESATWNPFFNGSPHSYRPKGETSASQAR